MMAVQSSASARSSTKVWTLRLPVATAPTLGGSCCQAVVELKKQCVRWSAQTTEAVEFAWANGNKCSMAGIPFILLYLYFRLLAGDALAVYSLLSNVPQPDGIPAPWDRLIEVSGLVLVAILVLALFFCATVEQFLGRCMPGASMPLWQLPLTILASPIALTLMSFIDIWGLLVFVIYGKSGVVLTHRAKAPTAKSNTPEAEVVVDTPIDEHPGMARV